MVDERSEKGWTGGSINGRDVKEECILLLSYISGMY
jgi:hypothetical protein